MPKNETSLWEALSQNPAVDLSHEIIEGNFGSVPFGSSGYGYAMPFSAYWVQRVLENVPAKDYSNRRAKEVEDISTLNGPINGIIGPGNCRPQSEKDILDMVHYAYILNEICA